MHKPVQLVDEEGNFKGVADSPFDAIKNGQIRLLARVILVNNRGDFLLQKRAEKMWMYPDCWDTSASGHVDEGETAKEAAGRELQEEIGVKADLKLVAKYYDELYIDRHDTVIKSYNEVYTSTVGDDISFSLESSEVSTVEWFDREAIESLIANQPQKCTDGLIKIFGDKLV